MKPKQYNSDRMKQCLNSASLENKLNECYEKQDEKRERIFSLSLPISLCFPSFNFSLSEQFPSFVAHGKHEMMNQVNKLGNFLKEL